MAVEVVVVVMDVAVLVELLVLVVELVVMVEVIVVVNIEVVGVVMASRDGRCGVVVMVDVVMISNS